MSEVSVDVGANAGSGAEPTSVESGTQGLVWYGLSNNEIGLLSGSAAPQEFGGFCPEGLAGSDGGILSLQDNSSTGDPAVTYACDGQGYGTFDTVTGNTAYLYAQNDQNGADGFRNIENALGADIGATDQPTYFGIYGGQVQFLNQMSGCGTTTHTNDSYDVCDAYYHGAWPSTVTLGSMQSLFQDSAMQTPAVTVTCPSIAFTEFQDSSVASNLGSAIDIFGFGACDGNSVETGASPSPAPQFQRIVLPHSQSGPFGITVGGSTLTTLYFVESATHQLGSWDEVTGQLSEYPLPDYALSLACDTSYCYIPEPKSDKIAIFEIANSQMSEVAVPTANAYPLYATIELDPPKNGVYQEHVYFTEAQGRKLGIITPPYLETPSAVRRLSPHHWR